MRIIIAGCRDFHKYDNLLIAIKTYEEAHGKITQIVNGGADGVDKLGRRWASNNDIDIVLYPPDWDKYGKAAGPIRNRQMAENADGLIALWDGKSRGTKNMIQESEKRGLKILIQYI